MVRGKWTEILAVFLMLLLVSSENVVAEDVSLYARRNVDAYLVEDGEKIQVWKRFLKGEPVICERSGENCCFEAEDGTVCLEYNALDVMPVKANDTRVNSVKFLKDGAVSACNNGESDLNRAIDIYVVNYGVHVNARKGSELMIVVEFNVLKNGFEFPFPSIQKKIVYNNVSHEGCYDVIVTKNDIVKFTRDYRKVHRIVSAEHDMNLPVKAKISAFSSGYDPDYSNNSIELTTLFPSESAEEWPNK